MEYYKLLQLKGEPFSNSPDPDYFFQSRQHHTCLQKLELAIRLKRGLNVVIGDVGTGKTTMCRELIRKFAQDPDIETHLLLDPSLPSSEKFLRLFHAMICDRKPDDAASEIEIKEQIKQTLFQKGVDRNKTIVLIIDEGQKISSSCVETIRELLNYETNHFKLLQIVIFAQLEIEAILKQHANFADRINLLHHMGPMSFADTRRMIHHRLKLASQTPKPRILFTLPALWTIYRATRGYPRKIVHLCHQSVLTMIIQNRTRAGWAVIRSCRNRMSVSQRSWRGTWITMGLALTTLCAVALLWNSNTIIDADHFGEINYKVPPPAPIGNATEEMATVTKTRREELQPDARKTESPPAARKTVTSQDRGSEQAHRQKAFPAIMTKTGPEDAPIVEPTVATLPPLALLVPQDPQPEPPVVDAAADEPFSPRKDMVPPAMLGELGVRPGDTFLGLVRLVYGTNENLYLHAVIEANPHIVNPNIIDLDDVLSFPALATPLTDVERAGTHIVLDEQPTLAAARAHLATMRHKYRIAIRLSAHWTPAAGLRFTVVSARRFNNEPESRWWTNRLPAELKQKTRAQTGWPEDTIIYSRLPLPAE